MKYVLLLLFFTTPPAPHLDTQVRKAKSAWTFKSSSTMEFDNRKACEANGQYVIDQLDQVDTMTATGWCLCKDEPGTICPADKAALVSSKDNKGFMRLQVQPRATDAPIEFDGNPLVSKSLSAIAKQNLERKKQ
jgi:hypothetical protein